LTSLFRYLYYKRHKGGHAIPTTNHNTSQADKSRQKAQLRRGKKIMKELEAILIKNGVETSEAKIIAILNDKGVDFPQAIKLAKSIKGTLTIYNYTNVWLENGRYDETPHNTIKRSYGSDHKLIATIKDSDIFTDKEIQANLLALNNQPWEQW
jgi:hypothetical protein